jgi:hypothetical protein
MPPRRRVSARRPPLTFGPVSSARVVSAASGLATAPIVGAIGALAVIALAGSAAAWEREFDGGGDHRRSAGVNRLDDALGVDASQIDRGPAEIAMPELALNDARCPPSRSSPCAPAASVVDHTEQRTDRHRLTRAQPWLGLRNPSCRCRPRGAGRVLPRRTSTGPRRRSRSSSPRASASGCAARSASARRSARALVRRGGRRRARDRDDLLAARRVGAGTGGPGCAAGVL